MGRFGNKISVIAALAMLLASCSGYLQENQTTGLQTSAYSSEAMLEANILGIIEKFSGTWGITGEPAEFYGIASGLTHWAGSSRLGRAKWDACLEFTQYATTQVNNEYFKKLYSVIQASNELIANLDSSPVNTQYKKEIEAEAVFYRAVAYFCAVRIWGDLPLRLTPATVANSTNCPRSPWYDIYTQIIKDLEFAGENMRTPERADAISPEVPRPNKYAAFAFLSSVYVTIGSLLRHPDDNFWNPAKNGRAPDFSKIGIVTSADAYKKALQYAGTLIPGSENYDSGCPYSLVEKFQDLFNFSPNFERNGYCAWRNPEQIFTLTYSPTSGSTSYMAARCLPLYPEGTAHTDREKTNGNMGRFRPNRWVFQKWCETYPGELTTVAFKGQDVSLYVTSADPRLDASLYYNEYISAVNGEVRVLYPRVLNTSVNSSDGTDKWQAFPYFKKYWSTTYNYDNGDADFYFMRYAEVFLNAAEAAAVLGLEDKAYEYIEALHSRARHSVPDGEADSSMPKWEKGRFRTTEDMLSGIFWERIFETYGECHEWNETHRNGAEWIVRNICIPKNAFIERWEQRSIVDNGSVIYPTSFRYSTDPSSVRKGLLASFPYEETLYNKAISAIDDQNDYYVQ